MRLRFQLDLTPPTPCVSIKKPGGETSGLRLLNRDAMIRLALGGDGLDLVVADFRGHFFADELLIDGGGWTELVALAADLDGFLFSVEFLELAGDVFGFAAASEGRSSEGGDNEGGEDGFHRCI